MKQLFTFLTVVGLFATTSFAQNLPIAVNDTFNYNYSDTAIVRVFGRSAIYSNDTLGSGTYKIIDTISYNGPNQVTVEMSSIPFIRVNKINFTTPVGYFGKDSITYYLTDDGIPTGFDTATIYIYVKRKDYENLDLNNINAIVHKNVLFGNVEQAVAGFEVPKGSGSNTIYSANLWFEGLDSSSQLKGYSETFASSFFPFNQESNSGPIMDSLYYENYSYQWDRVWKVSALDIQNHIAGNGTTEAILNWPAHGDVSKGQAPNLAPFVDVDNDNQYIPSNGDYPLIKGQQAIYFIRNSDRTLQSDFVKSGLEFHGMVYAYDCPEDSAINNTVFLDYTIYNRSTSTLTDCYFGQWVDFDLGFMGDDGLSCDISHGTFYAYNGDSYDESASGVIGYGANLPAQGVTFLKGAKQDDDGIDNPLTTDAPTALAQNGIPYAGLGTGFGDGTIDNEYIGLSHFMNYCSGACHLGGGTPYVSSEYYNYLKGDWKDSTHVKWGGNGHYSDPSSSGIDANYMYPRDSDPLFWSTNGVVASPSSWNDGSGDRRGMGSTGPFTLLAGESVEMELAFVFGIDYNSPGNNLAGITVMNERVDSIRSYHANGFATTPCGGSIIGVKTEAIQSNLLTIYPNPFNTQFIITYQPTSTAVVEVFNLLGNLVSSQTLTHQISLIDLSSIPNGVYFVKVSDGNKVITRKVVKQ